jgi:hypothetical protein
MIPCRSIALNHSISADLAIILTLSVFIRACNLLIVNSCRSGSYLVIIFNFNIHLKREESPTEEASSVFQHEIVPSVAKKSSNPFAQTSDILVISLNNFDLSFFLLSYPYLFDFSTKRTFLLTPHQLEYSKLYLSAIRA